MIVGKVIESVVATQKHASLAGHTLLVVQTENDSFIALDSVGAGPGDTVLVCNEGTGCRQIFDAGIFPVNHVIAGIVDHISL